MDATSQTLTRPTIRKQSKPRRPAQLRIMHPRALARVIPLRAGEAVLGRLPGIESPCRISHPTVSRTHLRISWDRSTAQHVAEDLSSHNGSCVDGEKVEAERAVLRDGSVIRVGDVVLLYESDRCLALDEASEQVSTVAIPGVSAAMRALRRTIARAAPDPSPLLLLGETGTGKEFAAREIHRLSGRRGPFLALNCAALSPQLIESQLFGHERGAFTGATSQSDGLFRAAHGGTLLLDEIGELPERLQPKLLRVLQEGEIRRVGATRSQRVDVRIVAATNRNLAALMGAGHFRRDLYARLALWEVELPPIRGRRADILDWIDRLHDRWCRARPGAHNAIDLAPGAAEAVLLASWDENLRGLDRLVHRLATLDLGARPVSREDVLGALPRGAPTRASFEPPATPRAVGERRPAPNRAELMSVMARHEGSVRAVAKYYGRERRQIYRWLKAFGLRD